MQLRANEISVASDLQHTDKKLTEGYHFQKKAFYGSYNP